MTNIFIESGTKTSNEYNFLKTLIEQCVGKKEKEDYILITVGGKDNLEKNKSKFSDHTGDAEKNLVIFDADMPENGGGFEQRKKDLTDKLKRGDWSFGNFDYWDLQTQYLKPLKDFLQKNI